MNKDLVHEFAVFKIDEKILSNVYKLNEESLETAKIYSKIKKDEYSSNSNIRNSKIKWIKDEFTNNNIIQLIRSINKQSNWNYSISLLEDLQYTVYNEDDHYNWHTDGNHFLQETVRKISFSIGLNDSKEYEGGELDIEIHGPNVKGKRFETIVLEKNQMICFKSNLWHRVRPVTKGVRKSLVGWVRGPNFI